MNNDLIQNFAILRDYYSQIKDKWRAKAYGDAIITLKNLDFKITSVDQLKGVKGIGKSIKEKIQEFLETGKIKKVIEVEPLMRKKVSEKDEVIKIFTGIWGVGEKTASSFYSLGMRTLADLEKNSRLLTANQKIGLKYYDELQQKIPRKNITIFQIAVRVLLNKKFGPKSYKMEVAGSYRRGQSTSGDLDILISSTKFDLRELVNLLQQHGLVTDVLSMKEVKFMGIGDMRGCGEGNAHFRLDIEFLPISEWITGLLYFTGSKNFNVLMRAQAKKLGYILNEHELFDTKTGKAVKLNDEKELFEILDMDYYPPSRR